jgi:hypothetical protein
LAWQICYWDLRIALLRPATFNVRVFGMGMTFLDARLKPSISLPAGFYYPDNFANYLLFEERERRKHPDTQTLHWRWPFELHFGKAVTEHVLDATRAAGAYPEEQYFVAFARDAGDGVWFFGDGGIYFVDLGSDSWAVVREDYDSFESFVNDWREGSNLEQWRPQADQKAL